MKDLPELPDPNTPTTNPPLFRDPPERRRFGAWLSRCFDCNPFYLLSVAVLVYGCYRVSLEPALFNRETAHLFFNFTALEVYEALIVGIAIFLSARRIWYDSTLLIGIENLLCLVPFLLISHASLIGPQYTWLMCCVGGVLGIARVSVIKLFNRELNFPRQSIIAAGVFLMMNVALPLVYRVLHEHKIGTKPDWGAAYYTDRYVWLTALPLLALMSYLLPLPRKPGDTWPRWSWLPVGFFALWLGGTIVHVYALDYVYDFSLTPEMLAPLLLALLWAARSQLIAFYPSGKVRENPWLLSLPAIAPLFAFTTAGSNVLLILAGLNTVAYLLSSRRQVVQTGCLWLAGLSLLTAIADVPENWISPLLAGFHRMRFVGGILVTIFMFGVAISRDPRLSVFGSALLGILIGTVFGGRAAHWAMESALLFILIHSFRWDDRKHDGARILRNLSVLAWCVHVAVWVYFERVFWPPMVLGAGVLAFLVVHRLWRHAWFSRCMVAGSGIVMCAAPLSRVSVKIPEVPAGLLLVIGSFVLLAAGTALALMRPKEVQ